MQFYLHLHKKKIGERFILYKLIAKQIMPVCLINPLGLLTSQQPTWLRLGAKTIALGT